MVAAFPGLLLVGTNSPDGDLSAKVDWQINVKLDTKGKKLNMHTSSLKLTCPGMTPCISPLGDLHVAWSAPQPKSCPEVRGLVLCRWRPRGLKTWRAA